MTHREFLRAFESIRLAIDLPRDRKPKNFRIATEGFRRGAKAKRDHIDRLKGMTLESLYELSCSLYAAEKKKT